MTPAPRAPDPMSDPDVARLVAATLRGRRQRKVLQVALGIAVPAALLTIWEILSDQGVIDRRFFPAPTTIVASGWEILVDPRSLRGLAFDVLATLQRLSIGYALGATAGIAFGILMGVYAPIRFGFSPMIFGTFPIPKLAYFPLLLIVFGIGDASKIALVTLGVFFMTCINTLSGVLYTNPIYMDMARAFRLPIGVQWLRVVLPGALPSIVAGLKLAMGNALILVVASEFVSSNTGIGKFIWNSWQVLDVAAMFVGLIVIAMIGIAVMMLGNWIERRLIPWARI